VLALFITGMIGPWLLIFGPAIGYFLSLATLDVV
jgi:hypothetical protein